MKYLKIESKDDFDWSNVAHVQMLYNYSKQNYWDENLDFLMLADELARLEKEEHDLEITLAQIEKAIKKDEDTMNSFVKKNGYDSNQNLAEKLKKNISRMDNISASGKEFSRCFEEVKELKEIKSRKEEKLAEFQQTKEKIYKFIKEEIINVGGKDKEKWLEKHEENKSDINFKGIKIFFPRIERLVNGGLIDFISSQYNKSQSIEIHVKPLSANMIKAYSAQSDKQQPNPHRLFSHRSKQQGETPDQQKEEHKEPEEQEEQNEIIKPEP